MLDQKTERELLEACLQGKESAREQLYKTYSGKLYVVCLRYAKDKDQANDMFQEGFIRIFQNLHTYQGSSALATWMHRVMVNASLEFLKKQRSWLTFEEDEGVLEQHSRIQVSPDALDKLSEAELLSLIEALPDGYRTVFNLYVFEGLSHEEISEQLGITESTSKTQLRKARIKLQEQIAHMSPELHDRYSKVSHAG